MLHLAVWYNARPKLMFWASTNCKASLGFEPWIFLNQQINNWFYRRPVAYCKSYWHQIELIEVHKMHLQFLSHFSLVHNAILHFILNISWCLISIYYCLPLYLLLITRLARSDPRNHFSVQKKFSIYSNFSVFHHVLISSLDMFKNCINSYHIESKQV